MTGRTIVSEVKDSSDGNGSVARVYWHDTGRSLLTRTEGGDHHGHPQAAYLLAVREAEDAAQAGAASRFAGPGARIERRGYTLDDVAAADRHIARAMRAASGT